jgi:hypothetical protein
MENHTPRNFALQLGALISLYVSASFLIVLLFGLINLRFIDIIDGYYTIEQAASNVRLAIAMLVVFFPAYLVLTRYVNRIRRTEVGQTYLTLTKWVIYLSLLIGGLIMLGDLVAVLLAFLNGDLTIRFILKALAVFGVIGAAMHYYILDARGFWVKNESKSIMYAIGAGLVVFTAIAFGFAHIETPATVREMKIDAEQIADLQNIQWRIEPLIASSSTVPSTIAELYPMMPEQIPTASEGREAYEYELTDSGFKLCATFAHPSPVSEMNSPKTFDTGAPIKNAYDWTHPAGYYCFERVI